jgi:ATP-dependent DNA ligase
MKAKSVSLLLLLTVGSVAVSACGSSSTPTVAKESPTAVKESEERASRLEHKTEVEKKAEESTESSPSASEEEERKKNLEPLLTHRHAIGMSENVLRQRLGSPEHIQEIEQTAYWYYKYELSIEEEVEYQVVIVNGVVRAVNRYS